MLHKLMICDKVAIFSHIRADLDCIGTQIALGLFLKQSGNNVKLFNQDKKTPNLPLISSFLPIELCDWKFIRQANAIVFIDGNHPKRFSLNEAEITHLNKPIWVIDHHPNPWNRADYILNDVNASSTAEIIAHILIKDYYDQISHPIAIALLIGIIGDTGGLQQTNTTPKTLRIVAKLAEISHISLGSLIAELLDQNYNTVQLLSYALSSIKLYHHNQLAIMSITENDFERYNCHHTSFGYFVNYALRIRGVLVGVLVYETDGKIKISFRSRPGITVNLWANKLGGGGHPNAAAAWDPGPIQQTIKKIISITKTQLDTKRNYSK